MTEDVLRPVARKFGVPLKEAVALARRAAAKDWSLNQRVRAGDPAEWGDRLADERESPEEDCGRRQHGAVFAAAWSPRRSNR